MKSNRPEDPAWTLAKTVIFSFCLFFFLWVMLIWVAILGQPVCETGSNVCIDLVSALNKSSKK